jgi:membrane protein
VRRWWRDSALRGYLKGVWDQSGDDNIFFLAGGIAFNILLAAVPFVLLLVSGLGYILNLSPAASLARASVLIDRLLPAESGSTAVAVHGLFNDIIRARGQVGLYSAIGFVWFSTRLFGSLRTVLANVFDIEDRGIIDGKVFDMKVTIVATLMVVAYTALSAYLAIATTRGVQLLAEAGVQRAAMGHLAYSVARVVAFGVIGLLCFALYKFLPNRHIRTQQALVSAAVASVLFEAARLLFEVYIKHFNPGSLYTGTLAALVIVTFWVYYAALLFILGGEVGQVYELRRVRRLQRESLL